MGRERFIPMTGNPENGNYLDFYQQLTQHRPADIVEAWSCFQKATSGMDKDLVARIRERRVTRDERATDRTLDDACRALEGWDVFANGAIGMPDE